MANRRPVRYVFVRMLLALVLAVGVCVFLKKQMGPVVRVKGNEWFLSPDETKLVVRQFQEKSEVFSLYDLASGGKLLERKLEKVHRFHFEGNELRYTLVHYGKAKDAWLQTFAIDLDTGEERELYSLPQFKLGESRYLEPGRSQGTIIGLFIDASNTRNRSEILAIPLGSRENRQIKFWNLATGKLIRTMSTTTHPEALAESYHVSRDGKWLIQFNETLYRTDLFGGQIYENHGGIRFWNISNGELEHTIALPDSAAHSHIIMGYLDSQTDQYWLRTSLAESIPSWPPSPTETWVYELKTRKLQKTDLPYTPLMRRYRDSFEKQPDGSARLVLTLADGRGNPTGSKTIPEELDFAGGYLNRYLNSHFAYWKQHETWWLACLKGYLPKLPLPSANNIDFRLFHLEKDSIEFRASLPYVFVHPEVSPQGHFVILECKQAGQSDATIEVHRLPQPFYARHLGWVGIGSFTLLFVLSLLFRGLRMIKPVPPKLAV